MTLLELCYNKPDLILLDSTNSLERAELQNYKDLTPEKLRIRLNKLFQAFVLSLEKGSYEVMKDYMKKVSNERFASGYKLHDVQAAINIMEECLWKKIPEHVSAEHQIEALRQVMIILNNAKETLIAEYASLKLEHINN